MRLFAAVLPPDTATAELAEAARVEELPGAGDGAALDGRDSWHFTLAFMARSRTRLVRTSSARLERAAQRTAPFPLALRGSGHFGDRALWAGATGDVDALRLLAQRADAAARKAGIARRSTGATARTSRSPAAARSGPRSVRRPCWTAFEGAAWTAGELTLVRSNLPDVAGCRGSGRGTRRSGGGHSARGREGPVNLEAWTRKPETGSWPVCSC